MAEGAARLSPRLVKVVWEDACMEFSIKKGEHVTLTLVETVGWLTYADAKFVNVSQEDADADWRAVTAIPRSLILDIVPVRGTRPVRGARSQPDPHKDGHE
jgi:hypothetical protein